MIKHACLLTLFTTLLSLSGCGVDESRNVQRKTPEECLKGGGRVITLVHRTRRNRLAGGGGALMNTVR